MKRTAPGSTPEGSVELIGNERPSARSTKVRAACERCRHRRIKCDGQVPACGNCNKAGVLCVDSDSRNTGRRVARGFSASGATARIAWLENIIRVNLPQVDLNAGPSCFTTNTTQEIPIIAVPAVESPQSQLPSSDVELSSREQNRGQKRPSGMLNEASSPAGSVEEDTRSVALNLGLLSLNADSRQTHYMGSSSGSLFASLFQAKKGDRNNFTVGSVNDHGSNEPQFGRRHDDNGLSAFRANEIREDIERLYDHLLQVLPRRQECDVLIARYFQHMHTNHPFLHQPSVYDMVDALYQCLNCARPCQLQYNGWLSTVEPFSYNGEEASWQGNTLIPISVHVAAFQLLMILSIGATLQIRVRRYSHDPMTFFNAAHKLSGHVFSIISLPTLQALSLLAVHSLIDPEGCNIWTLTRTAMAYAIDLGIHRTASKASKFSALNVQMRRRIFYCLYALDRTVSVIQGRPLAIDDKAFDVELPAIELENMRETATVRQAERSDLATMVYSIEVFKMAKLVSKIKCRFYMLPDLTTVYPVGINQHEHDQEIIRIELEHWLEQAIAALGPQQRLRLSTKLNILYHSAVCLLFQPSQAILQPSDYALQRCFASATKKVQLYEQLYETGTLCHSWRTVQDTFLAGITIMYCIFISEECRQQVSLPLLARDFRSCSTMLSVGGEWWPIMRKARLSFERMATHTLDLLADQSESRRNKLPRSSTSYAFSTDISDQTGGFGSGYIGNALSTIMHQDVQLASIHEDIPTTAYFNAPTDLDGLRWDMNPEVLWENFPSHDFTDGIHHPRDDMTDLQGFLDTLEHR